MAVIATDRSFDLHSARLVMGDGVCDDSLNYLETGYDGGDCCSPNYANYIECRYCECLENKGNYTGINDQDHFYHENMFPDTDGYCNGDDIDDNDCCSESSVCDCTNDNCLCQTDGLKKCHNPEPIGGEQGKYMRNI